MMTIFNTDFEKDAGRIIEIQRNWSSYCKKISFQTMAEIGLNPK
jgi:hypothetical protein